jgi:hypothetical protein
MLAASAFPLRDEQERWLKLLTLLLIQCDSAPWCVHRLSAASELARPFLGDATTLLAESPEIAGRPWMRLA